VGLILVTPGTFEKVRRERGQDAQFKETHLLPVPAPEPEVGVLARF
jgi:hypothetical protein